MKLALIIGGIIVLLLGAAGVIVVVALPGDFVASLTPKPPRTKVRVEPAVVDTLVETVTAPGEIEPLTKVEISGEISARIEQLPVREGDEVKSGDVIVRLDDRDLKAGLESAEARRDGERFRLQSEEARISGLLKTLAFAKKTLERQQALYDTGDVSRSALDEALERVEDLEATVQSSTHEISVIESSLAATEADIARANQALEKTTIRAPMDGVVTLLNAEVGEVVLVGTMNNPGTVILTVADLSRMLLNARAAESDIAKIQEGQRARIHINAYPDEVFTGFVRRIALQRTTQLDGTGYFEIEVEIELSGRRIYSGLVANVDIEIAAHEGIVVQSQAVVERLVEDLPQEIRELPLVDRNKKTTTVLYRMIDGKAVCTPVKPGASDLTHRVVREGLAIGDQVIVGPYKVLESIKHDALIEIDAPDAAKTAVAGAEGAPASVPAADSEPAAAPAPAPGSSP